MFSLLNVTDDYEFNKLMESLDLSYEDMVQIETISNLSETIENKRSKLLEYLAGTADGNYETMVKQFNKVHNERVLKEELTMNQVVELNNLVDLVRAKITDNKECLTNVYDLIARKSSEDVAKTFIGMTMRSVAEPTLKFDTDLEVNGVKLTDMILPIKNELEIICSNVKKENKENKEGNEPVQESFEEGLSIAHRIAGIIDINSGEIKELKEGQEHNMRKADYEAGKIRFGIQNTPNYGVVSYITAANRTWANRASKIISEAYSDINIDTWNLEFKNNEGKREFVKLDSNGRRLLEKSLNNFTSEEIHKQMIKESSASYQNVIEELNKAVDTVDDLETLKTILKRVESLLAKVHNMNEANEIAMLKSTVETKIASLLDVKPQIEECLASSIAQSCCGEDTFNGLLDTLKPTFINITVNKDGDCVEDSCSEDCCEEPCENCCEEPVQGDVVDSILGNVVQPMKLSPTAIDTPVLAKPNSAEVTSAITALASHSNDIKSDSRESNYENLLAINALLDKISDYFTKLLSEGVENDNTIKIGDELHKIGDPVAVRYRVTDIIENRTYKLFYLERNIDGATRKIASTDEVILQDFEIVREQLEEDTVYDHSWYEVEGQKYPKRTKEGVEIDETCSCGATCAGSVATVSTPIKKTKKKRKPETFDVSLFKESIKNGCPATLTINGKKIVYKLVEGNGYLYIDDGIVKTLDKNVMLETVDDVYNNCLGIDVLNDCDAYRLQYLLEDEDNDDKPNSTDEMADVNSDTVITSVEKQARQKDLDTELNNSSHSKINVVTGDNEENVLQNQEFVGIDDSDPEQKKYIVKDPATGKVTVASYNQIKVVEGQEIDSELIEEGLQNISIKGVLYSLNNDEKKLYQKVKSEEKLLKDSLSEYDQRVANSLATRGLLKRCKNPQHEIYFVTRGRRKNGVLRPVDLNTPPDRDLQKWVEDNEERYKEKYGKDYRSKLMSKAWQKFNGKL